MRRTAYLKDPAVSGFIEWSRGMPCVRHLTREPLPALQAFHSSGSSSL